MKRYLKKIKNIIRYHLGITSLLEGQIKIENDLSVLKATENDVLKSIIFNNTIIDSCWLKNKSFSPGGWAADYALLYTLYRVLNEMNPKSILEFGLGQTSKLIHQYSNYFNDVNAITCEHDAEWINFFLKSIDNKINIAIKNIQFETIDYKGEKTLSVKDISIIAENKYDLIVIDSPYGSPHYSRSQILNLAENSLLSNFCIIIDDYERTGEQETVEELCNILNSKNIKFLSRIYYGLKQHILICDENSKFLSSM